jgi:hypothetical protein
MNPSLQRRARAEFVAKVSRKVQLERLARLADRTEKKLGLSRATLLKGL